MTQISACGAAAPTGLTSWNPRLPRPPGSDVSSPLMGRGDLGREALSCLHGKKAFRPCEISQLDSRKTVNERHAGARGHFLVPEGISAAGDVSLALTLLEISSYIGGLYGLVINNLGFCQRGLWRSEATQKAPCLHRQFGISLPKACHPWHYCLVAPGLSNCG